mmetsp:Transcript_2344/g.5154  ORF Transcript_2344/g.5154 Transcript_2344/m.5154 type:complete len:208 (+) Transcript_2344:450-1073(+)
MRLHRLHEPYGLGVCTYRQRPLHDVVPEGVHHELPEPVGVVQLVEVLLPDPVGAPLEALLHYIRAELLHCQDADFPHDALAYRVYLVVAAYVEHVLHDIVSVRVLHQLQALLDDAVDEVRPRGRVARVETPLDHAAAVPVPSNVLDGRGHSVEYKLGPLIRKFQEYPLDGVVAVRVDAEPCRGRPERVGEYLRRRVLLLFLLLPRRL